MARNNKSQFRWASGPQAGRSHRPGMRRAAAATFIVTAVAPTVAQAQEGLALPGAQLPPVPGEAGGTIVPGGAPIDLRNQLWVIIPRVSVEETVTDNVRLTPTNRQSDLITTVSPGLFVSRESQRIQGSFDYSPQLLRHIQATDQDTIAQNLLGKGTFTAVRDYLFVDTNASISEQSRSGARGFGNTNEVTSGDRTQQMVTALSPYLRFRVGDLGASQIRYRVSNANFSGNTGPVTSTITGQTLPGLSSSTEQEGTASFTATAFSRLQATTSVDYDTITYTNSALSSRRTSGSVDFSYAVTHAISALFSGGYERLNYSTQSILNTSGPTYSVGLQYQLNDTQSATITYGHQAGSTGIGVKVRYALTPLTTLSANYSKQRLTTQQQLAQGLLTATPIAPGIAIDANTGLPIALSTGLQNPNLPLQDDVVVSDNAQIGLTNSFGRNQFAFVVTRANQTSVLHLAPNSSSTGGYLSWGRELSPSLNSNLVVGYSVGTPDNTRIATLSASLGYNISDSLQAGAFYSVYDTSGGLTKGILANSLTLSVTKTF